MNIFNSIRTLTLALILSIGVGYTYAAWAPPSTAPTGGNAEAPLNTGSATQLKAGGLGVNGLFTAMSNLIVNGNVGIKTASPIRALTVGGGEISIIRQAGNKTAFLNVSDDSGNDGQSSSLQIRGLNDNGNVGTDLNIDMAGNVKVSGNVQTPTLCLNGDCKSAWPAGGGSATSLGVEFINTCYAGYNSPSSCSATCSAGKEIVSYGITGRQQQTDGFSYSIAISADKRTITINAGGVPNGRVQAGATCINS